MVFLPSFEYLDIVARAFTSAYPKIRALVQRKDMTSREKAEFLDEFNKEDGSYLVGFCVLGGIYSEGVDLVGDKLIGAVVVGIGLPSLSYEREAMTEYYEERFEQGKQYAYIYPGMNRVLQAAGRVIREENDRGVIGFISVSGYATKEGASRIPQTAKEFGYAEPVLQKAYGTLCGTVPDRERVDTLIAPLCLMLELAYRKERGEEKKENVLTRILRYIQMNYSVDLTEEELCRLFGCSRSYFSHTFRRETGKSFREYLTDVRLENAKRLLAFSHLNVTEISFAIGYTDSNYFSNVFKKKEGVSPRTYRKSLRHEP